MEKYYDSDYHKNRGLYDNEIEYLPASIAAIINKKEGEERYKVVETKKIELNNNYINNIIEKANSIKDIPINYKPKKIIKETTKQIVKKEIKQPVIPSQRSFWFKPQHAKYNFDRYVYGRLYAQLYEFGECEIIDDTSKIYSWLNYLQGFRKNEYLLWYDIQNVDKYNSKLVYMFNRKNIKPQYKKYLRAIQYCIDNNYDPRKNK